MHLVNATLELVAVVADNLYLLSRLRIVPLSLRDTARADKLSDYAALGAALVGLVQVQRERRVLYAAGRRARRRTVDAEKKLDEYEFWEDVTAPGKGERGGEGVGGGTDDERREEQKRLRERVKNERKRLKQLRSEVRESRVERVRLVAEGIFAGASVPRPALHSSFRSDFASSRPQRTTPSTSNGQQKPSRAGRASLRP